MGKSKEPRKTNRGPELEYTEELGKLVCDRIATNDLGLRALCQKYPELPSEECINLWRWKVPEFAKLYRTAKEAQAELMVENSKEKLEKIHWYTDAQGNKRVDIGFSTAAKNEVDFARWYATKLAPRLYNSSFDSFDNRLESLHEQRAMKEELMRLRAELAEKNKKDY